MAPKAERWSAAEVTPSLANSPSAISIWQRPQIPRPPQTESMSTPRLRAACSSGVPSGNRPRRPEGMKTTSASGLPAAPGAAGSGTAAAAFPAAPGTLFALGQRLAELLDPAHAILIMAHGDVGAEDRRHLLRMERIGDGRGHARTDQHGKKRSVEAVAVGQAEAEIGGTASGVDLQLLPEPADQMEDAASRLIEGADRHDQWIDDDIGIGNAVIRGALDDLLRHLEAHVRILGDAGLVIGDGDDGGPVFLHQRQHALQPLLLAGDGVEQRLALVDGKPRLERGNDGGIDGK